MAQAYSLKEVKRQICTMQLPATHLEQIKEISERTGIPRNTLAALALDEFLQRHYPNIGQEVMSDEYSEPTDFSTTLVAAGG
jgi:hypothetical protein